MLGVVLWCDSVERKAVIWCEDHGNLAFFNGMNQEDALLQDFDAGDLVQFNMSESGHLRIANNPRRIEENSYPDLASSLRNLNSDQSTPAHDPFQSAQVIAFRPKSKSKNEKGRSIA